MKLRPEHLSDRAVTKRGWIRKRENTTIMWVQVGTVVLAIINILMEGMLVTMDSMGMVEDRSSFVAVVGGMVIFFAFFSIPVRRLWTFIVNAVFLLYYSGGSILQLSGI